MAYIIAVCGAGGKTSYIRKLAEQYAAAGKKTAVSTTTHIGCPAAFLYCGEYMAAAAGTACGDPIGTGTAAEGCREQAAELSGKMQISDERRTPGPETEHGTEQETAAVCMKYRISAGKIRDRELAGNEKAETGAASNFGEYDVLGCSVTDPANTGGAVQKLCFPGEAAYRKMCAEYDVILLEADGSRHRPIKIPASYEPVIPENADEIVVVMGLQAVGRSFGTVCHRAELLKNAACAELPAALRDVASDTTVTRELIEALAEHFYISPLSKIFPGKSIQLCLNDMKKWRGAGVRVENRRPALILLASGFGRRFGSNKLLQVYQDRPLYQHVLSHIRETAEILAEKGIGTEAIVCTAYEEIEAALRAEQQPLHIVRNTDAAEGISASIRLGTQQATALGCTDAVFFAADMPFLPSADIARYIEQYLYSGKSCAVMCGEAAGKRQEFLSNPGILSAVHFPELLQLSGEQGGMRVIRKYSMDTYFYQIEAEKLRDIDVPEDLPECRECKN